MGHLFNDAYCNQGHKIDLKKVSCDCGRLMKVDPLTVELDLDWSDYRSLIRNEDRQLVAIILLTLHKEERDLSEKSRRGIDWKVMKGEEGMEVWVQDSISKDYVVAGEISSETEGCCLKARGDSDEMELIARITKISGFYCIELTEVIPTADNRDDLAEVFDHTFVCSWAKEVLKTAEKTVKTKEENERQEKEKKKDRFEKRKLGIRSSLRKKGIL